jgi:hypothetical protein
LSQINFGRQAIEQLKLHPLSSLWTLKYTTNDIRARWEIMLEGRLASTPHINQNRLSKMPPEKSIYWPLRIIKKSLIKMIPGNPLAVKAEVYDLVVILN